MSDFELVQPWFLLCFILIIPLIIKDKKIDKTISILVTNTKSMQSNNWISKLFYLLKFSKYFILSALIIALARPRSVKSFPNIDESKVIDIILAVDVSYSMLAKDLQPDRLTALKSIAKDFIKKRNSDRIGLVAYSGETFLKVPLTSDHAVVLREIDKLNSGELQPGTAIGNGLASAVKHIKESKAKSKIIILMTDGVDTVFGALNPLVAAEMAKNNNIKVYSIGLGTNGFALTPTKQDYFGELIFTEEPVNIDEATLTEISQTTNAKYFRATDNAKLSKIYDEINRLEKSNVAVKLSYQFTEYFRYFLLFAFLILSLDLVLRWGIFKRIN